MKMLFFSGFKGEKRKYMLLLCFACLAVNLLFSRFALWLNMPLYLDNIGSALAAALGGVIPGIIVGFLTNVINGIMDGTTIYYGSVTVLIAICSALFAEHGFYRKPVKWPVIILVFTLIGGGLGSILTRLLNDFQFASVPQTSGLAHYLLDHTGMAESGSQFAADMLIDLLDKTITVLLIALVLHLIPEKWKNRFFYSGWRQAPLSVKTLAKESRGLHRRSLRFKVILLVALATMITGVAVTTISYMHYRDAAIESQDKLAEGTAEVVAGTVNVEHMAEYIRLFNGAEDSIYREEYLHAEDIMQSLMDSSEYIEYCYVYQITPQGCIVVFDPDISLPYAAAEDLVRQADEAGDEQERKKLLDQAYEIYDALGNYRDSARRKNELYIPAHLISQDEEDAGGMIPDTGASEGKVYMEDFDKDFLDKLPDLLAGKEVPPRDVKGKYGWTKTFYKAIKDRNGVTRCYAGVDINLDHIARDGQHFLARVISLFFGFFVIILTVSIWLAEYNVILPINSMAMEANRSSFDTEEARTQAIDNIEKLDIHTQDEIENLYTAIIRTTKDMAMTTDSMAKAIAETQRQSALIGKMQNGLILVLADMVESRDQNTGEHVRKTAAYTGVIMRELKKEHIYEDQLTDEYIQDVMNSAPLHDVGKIQVPDSILNKPGKLTDEEFTTMKTHTSAGAEIIASAMAIVSEENSGYLKEASNLAHYHHEKWNGMGYPKGLKGEEIPLSARIMAVADVFDALVSKRSYKDGFPFEKAMDIIREGIGTHFDPNVANAFIHASDEVRKIMDSQMMGRESITQAET